jgi:enoyl-CoA hydratase
MVWRQLATDDEARVVILTGEGRAFSAGGDLDWIASFKEDRAARSESVREGAEIIDEMLRFPLPVVAAVNGPAVGLGCSIALLSDVVLISESAYFADPHISVGLVAGDGGAALWPLLTNIMRTREFLLTGQKISASLAVELGLASRTTSPDDLIPEARKLAARLAQQPAFALQASKRVLNMHLARALSGVVQAGFAAEEISMQDEEHHARISALRNKEVK